VAISSNPGIWMAALLTIFIYTFVYKENPAFRWAEHTLIGLTAGVYTVNGLDNIRKMVIDPIVGGNMSALIMLIPLAMGLLLFTRFSKTQYHYSRWMMAMLIASAVAAGMVASAQSRVMTSIIETFPTGGDLMTTFNELVMLIAVISTIIFFTYTRPHTGVMGSIAYVGRYALMLALGVNFGNAFSSRMGYIIGRLNFLLLEWLGI
jgi:uncharacterized membrane protein YeiB